MSKARFLAKIQALDGCVLYFPHRKTRKVVMGDEATRRGWGERWFQIRIEPVRAEVRLEGDNALDLGRGLSCNVVAKLEAQINTGVELSQSLSLVVTRFLCAPTNDRDIVLGTAAFAQPLANELRTSVLNVMAAVGYRDILDNPSYVGTLRDNLKDRIEVFLQESGFRMLSCTLRAELLKPIIGGAEPDIARKWIDWEIAQIELDREIEHRKGEADCRKDVKDREIKERREKLIKEIELRELEMVNEFAKKKIAKEIEKAQTEAAGRIDIAKAEKQAEDYFQGHRDQISDYEEAQKKKERDSNHAATLDETEKAAERKRREQDLEQSRAKGQLDDENAMRQKRLIDEDKWKTAQIDLQLAREAKEAALKDAVHRRKLEQAKQKFERLRTKAQAAEMEKAAALAQIELTKAHGLAEAEILLAKGKAEAEIIQAKGKAERLWEEEILREQFKVLTSIQASLPDILKSIPAGRSGETTLIQVGGSGGDHDILSDGTSVLGLVYLPIIKKIVDRFTASAGSSS